MLYSDELTLLLTIKSSQDEFGFPFITDIEKETTVYGEEKSVGLNEFYKAAMAGITCTLKFVVNAYEYGGEEYALYKGTVYKIIRSYTTPNGEKTELTLSDMGVPQIETGGGSGGKV